nr:hypothetical protein [Myxococcota bacterium]
VYESDDPFSRAQRDRVTPRAIAILGQVGVRARSAGDLGVAARAFDARWTLGGEARDPQLAAVLTAWAERDEASRPGEALYLARRARRADPRLARAEELDHRLSTNRRLFTARMSIVAGIVAFGVGAYLHHRVGKLQDELAMQPRPGDEVDRVLARRDLYDVAGTTLLIAAPVITLGGLLYGASGIPHHRPTSPAELPALEAR